MPIAVSRYAPSIDTHVCPVAVQVVPSVDLYMLPLSASITRLLVVAHSERICGVNGKVTARFCQFPSKRLSEAANVYEPSFSSIREIALPLKSRLFWLRGFSRRDGSLENALSPHTRESVFSLCTFTLIRYVREMASLSVDSVRVTLPVKSIESVGDVR